MKLLVDHNISPYLARAVGVVVEPDGHTVIALKDKFSPDATDETWIETLGREGGWAVLTDDHRIRKNPAERAAWRSARLKGFFLAPGWRKFNTIQKTGRLLLWWPRLVDADKQFAEGAVVELPIGPGSRFRPYMI
ncbi:MAG: hypothetical protein IMF08_13330 [Proteobacteria bacterium]|nr:hypothetical protein [Pseudomonadota bacterium]